MEYTSSSYKRLDSGVDEHIGASFESIDIDKNGVKEGSLKPKRKRILTADIFRRNEMEVVVEGSNTYSEYTRTLYRKLHDIRTFVIVVCFYILTFVMVETYIMAVLTTIEKRFGFRSSSSGALMSAKEIAYVCVVTFSSHFGNKWHRPRFLSVMAILGGTASLISALPHFIYDSPYHVRRNTSVKALKDIELTCLSNSSETDQKNDSIGCDMQSDLVHNDGAYALFQVSNILIGISITPMIALTTTYVDDAAGPKSTAFYFAFMNMMRPFGPVLAFLCGGLFTSLHESLEDPGYGASDPRWVGAWWLGYLTNPCLLLVAAILISAFPRKIQRESEEENGVEMESKKKPKKGTKKQHDPVSDFFKSLWRLLKNPAFVCLMTSGCFSSFVVSGMFPFMPKYIEVQFHMSASKANVLTGMVGALLAGLGVLLGGIISSRLNLKPIQSAMFILITNVLFLTALLIMMTVKCPERTFIGGESPAAECNSTCWCPSNDFDPVCGSDGRTFFSPCHAGCSLQLYDKTYGDCSCVEVEAGVEDRWARPGGCESDCQQWLVYMVVLAAGAIIGMMASVPGTTICLRIVEDRDRSIAIGFSGTIISLASFVPGPLLYGSLIDSACLVWDEKCGVTGSCRRYDNDKFRFLLHGTTAALKGIAAIFNLLLWLLIKRRKKRLMISTELSKDELSDTMSESSDTL